MSDTDRQLTLFPGECPGEAATAESERWSRRPGSSGNRRVLINPHLLAARRIAKKMRRIRDRETETQAGLAICAQLRAYLADDSTDPAAPTH